MKEYEAALKFWNENFKEAKPEKEEKVELGCAFLEEKLKNLTKSKKILDFGCGSGWASYYMAKVSNTSIVGVDQSAYAINFSKENAALNDIADKVTYICADNSYFINVKDNEFDGFFSCNTFDIMPVDVADDILKRVQRVCTPDANIIITLNSYLTEELKKTTKMTQISDDIFTYEGNLRVVNRSKEEWIKHFEKYFKFIEFHEFKFDQEPENYIRRMFILKNNK